MTCYWGHGMRWNERDLPQSWRLSVSTENCEGASLRKKQGECEDTQYIFNALWTSEQGEHDSIITNNIHKRCFPFMIYTQPFTPYITIFSMSGTPRIPQNPVESSLVHRISQHILCTLCNSRTFSSFKACSFQSASRHCSVVTEVAATDGASTASTTSPWSVPSVPCSCR